MPEETTRQLIATSIQEAITEHLNNNILEVAPMLRHIDADLVIAFGNAFGPTNSAPDQCLFATVNITIHSQGPDKHAILENMSRAMVNATAQLLHSDGEHELLDFSNQPSNN